MQSIVTIRCQPPLARFLPSRYVPSQMLTKEEVVKIARLARLSLSDSEVTLYQSRLGKVLEYVKQLEEVSGKNEASVRHIPEDALSLRVDKAHSFIDPHSLLENAPSSEAHHFLLPTILEET